MTEHIIQFGVGIDDDAIIESVKANAEHIIIRDIERDVLKKIFEGRYYNDRNVYIGRNDMPEVSDTALFTGFAKKIIEETIGQYKDAIIQRAADSLVESYKRTKAWKEKADEVLNE